MCNEVLETIHQKRKKITDLLDEAKLACDRALFQEVYIWNVAAGEPTSKKRKSVPIELKSQRSWTTILSDIARLSHFMKIIEQELISKYATIYLLGFLNPNSTGCNFFTLRSMTLKDGLVDAFFELDLEERLEDTSRYFSANEFDQINVCIDGPRERAFNGFLRFGLAALWRESVASNTTDILHLVAMVIAPQLDTSLIGNIVAPWEDIPAWIKASRLMGCLYPHSFPLHYTHRLLTVKLVFENLLLPEINTPNAMLAGAVPHLLAALYTFARHMARTSEDAHLAHQALVQISTQTGQELIVREVFYNLLSQTIEDKNQCKCRGCKVDWCPHAARGKLLQQCIISFNGSRHYADGTFTEQALIALKASLEELLSPWREEAEEFPHSNSACILRTLLYAIEALFHFLLDFEHVTGLLELIIQLLHHSDSRVRIASSSLLSLAFSHIQSTDIYMNSMLENIKAAIETVLLQPKINIKEFQSVVSVAARKSTTFAISFLSFLIESRQEKLRWKSNDEKKDIIIANFISYLIASGAMPNPRAAYKKVRAIQSLFKFESKRNNSAAASNLIAALLSTRKAFIFQKQCKEVIGLVRYFASESVGWRAYQMACHAMCTGNFEIAEIIYTKLTFQTSTQRSFLWISSLSKIAEAEKTLNQNGPKSIPFATTSLQAAVSYVETLSLQDEDFMVFQIEFLRLRLDFLDLTAALRLICRETRLSGTVPKNSTRVGLHLVNNLKCWGALANRYFSLYRRHGLFLCMQSRTTLRTMNSICRHLRNTSIKLIGETFMSKNEQAMGPKGDEIQPIIRLQKEVQNSFLSNLDKFVEPAVRTTALGELLEGICRTPIPFPRGFVHTIKIQPTKLYVSLEPSHKYTSIPKEELQTIDIDPVSDSVTIYAGAELTVCASGSIPEAIIKRAHSAFSRLLIWGNIEHISLLRNSDLEEGRDDGHIEGQHIPFEKKKSVPAMEVHMSQSRKFTTHIELPSIKTVGIHRVNFKLGCRDLACGEWELLNTNSSNAIFIKVSRRLEPKEW
mmetsp:Transcript_37120/g.42353  ORF Transcript_37120/g.42353 Transcript_37120/m.42353 type:complete len:1025 (+) Transcript_37120:102-3176(+)